MRSLAILSLLFFLVPTATHAAAGDSIVDLNPATPTPDASVVATPQPTAVPSSNPVTGNSPYVPLFLFSCLGGIAVLYVLQRRPS